MPQHGCVRVHGSSDSCLQAGTLGVAQPGAMDLTGVLAIKPQARPWKFTPATCKASVKFSCAQVSLLPRKQCTLHGVQGKTADPGFIAHWAFSPWSEEGVEMAGLLRQLVEASQLQAVAEPWVAGARGHRIWTARGDCQSLPGAVRGQDLQDEDRLREGSGGDGLVKPQRCMSKH